MTLPKLIPVFVLALLQQRDTRELEELAGTLFVCLVVLVVGLLLIWGVRRMIGSRRRGSAAGNALMAAEVFVNPARRHTIDALQRDDKQEDESGEPPSPR